MMSPPLKSEGDMSPRPPPIDAHGHCGLSQRWHHTFAQFL
jgi:hypothetical protein